MKHWNTRTQLCTAIVALLIWGVQQNGIAQTLPQHFSYQGILVDQHGIAYPDGTYNMTFRLYDASLGGSPLWEETIQVQLSDGVFDALLGGQVPFGLPFDRQYWLGVQLGGEAEMEPRISLVAVPYSLNAMEATQAKGLTPDATGAVRSLNGLSGDLQLLGEGDVSIAVADNQITISAAYDKLPQGTQDGETLQWNAATGAWEPAEISVHVSSRLAGDGSIADPLDIASMGATEGQTLLWNAATGAWEPGTIEMEEISVETDGGITGNGSSTNPVRIVDGTAAGQILYWNGNTWQESSPTAPNDGDELIWDQATGSWTLGQKETSVAVTPQLTGDGSTGAPIGIARQGAVEGQVLRWDNTTETWHPADVLVVQSPPFQGTGTAQDPLRLTSGTTPGNFLFWDGTEWRITPSRTPLNRELLQWNAQVGAWEPTDRVEIVGIRITENAVVEGDLTVNGANVNLPNGSIDNAELANASVNVSYGTGVSGDASVVLGGTLNLQNTGVTALTAGNGITVDQATGNVTITNNGLLSATAGTGINVTTTNGAATIANTGVTSLTGTANQVTVDQATGGVTLSLPQDIHSNASPTFDGLTLDNINNASAANQIVVSNNGAIESRSFNSLFPGGLLPGGTSNNSTLRWDGTNWVENTAVTADGSGNTTLGGDLTVNGANVNLPNGSIDNAELTNASVNISYGTGVSGDASVALGGTLNLQNTGVTALIAGNGINVDQATGSITITSSRIALGCSRNGNRRHNSRRRGNYRQHHVTSLTGTANQVIVDQATGGVTLSLPQDIHSNASPTFDGLTLDNINNASAANQIVVSNNGAIESVPSTPSSPVSCFPAEHPATARSDGMEPTGWRTQPLLPTQTATPHLVATSPSTAQTSTCRTVLSITLNSRTLRSM